MEVQLYRGVVRTGFESRWGSDFSGSAGGVTGHALSLTGLLGE